MHCPTYISVVLIYAAAGNAILIFDPLKRGSAHSLLYAAPYIRIYVSYVQLKLNLFFRLRL